MSGIFTERERFSSSVAAMRASLKSYSRTLAMRMRSCDVGSVFSVFDSTSS